MGKLKIKLPTTLKQEKVLYVCPKQPERHSWLLPQIYPVTSKGFVEVVNKTSSPIQISKLEHFANVYLCMEVELNNSDPEAMVQRMLSDAKAIGGQLAIHRIIDGRLKKLLGAHF